MQTTLALPKRWARSLRLGHNPTMPRCLVDAVGRFTSRYGFLDPAR